MSEVTPATPGLQLRDVSLHVGGRTLLEGASVDFPHGAVTLIVGASGSGKSTLLRLLAGLLDSDDTAIDAHGSVCVEGVEILDRTQGVRRGRAPVTGIIFQSFALFDELSALDNLRFAAAHRRSAAQVSSSESSAESSVEPPAATECSPEGLFAEFGLPHDTPVSAMSGGEKQRLAIARTLAYDPAVILYDEPTSGLDPANALRVAKRIRETARAHRKTTVVVTHDYPNLAGIADAVFFLSQEKKTLEPIAPAELARSPEKLVEGAATDAGRVARPSRSLREQAVAIVTGLLEKSGRFLEQSLQSLLLMLPIWRSPRWGLRYFAHYLRVIASPSAWLYFGAAGVITGFVSTHFVFKFLPQKKYTEPLIIDEILSGLGFASYRILVPVLLTVLLAARCGAAIASDIGGRLYGQQIAAMRSLGAPPARYLLTNVLYAFLVATPLLVGLGFVAARTTSAIVFTHNYPGRGANYWDVHFHRDLLVPEALFYRGTGWLLAKLLCCGLGVGAIAYHTAMRRKTSSVEVSRDITITIILATLYVLVVHFVFAFVEF